MSDLTWNELLEQLRRDNRSGATTLARLAAANLPSLAVEAAASDDPRSGIRSGLRSLATVRPPFGALCRLASWAAQELDQPERSDYAAALSSVGNRFLQEVTWQHESVVRAALPLVGPATRVVCFSASSVVRDVLLATAQKSSPGLEVTCLQSSPTNEGVTLANELAKGGLSVRLTADAALGRLLGKVELILLGGDSLTPGGLVHKLGTLTLALAARQCGTAVYALTGSLKLIPSAVRGWREDGGQPSELGADYRPGVEVWNPYYDLTPFDLLTGIVTEDGLICPSQAASLASEQVVHPWLADVLEA
jgi:translation initiation factor eIF-2B subunit delta